MNANAIKDLHSSSLPLSLSRRIGPKGVTLLVIFMKILLKSHKLLSHYNSKEFSNITSSVNLARGLRRLLVYYMTEKAGTRAFICSAVQIKQKKK